MDCGFFHMGNQLKASVWVSDEYLTDFWPHPFLPFSILAKYENFA